MQENVITPNKKFMREAIRHAQRAQRAGDYAVGAVLVKGRRILAAAGNRSKRDESPVAHAETLTILKGSRVLGKRHLEGCVLYSTHEPCPMCASVIVWARLKGVVYGARYEDMRRYRRAFANSHYLWRTIDIPCRAVFAKSTERIEVVKDFLRRECVGLFHSA